MGIRGYHEAQDALSSLITKPKRATSSNRGDSFHLMYNYLQILELEKPLLGLSVIHVAGTKGKGSTCAFSESILRACGYKTGLFISPHLIDVRERFRLNGMEVSEDTFLEHFWWCWDRLKVGCSERIPMPAYFRFLTLLAFKIFISEKVDVVILEVGLGGKFDSTNVVKEPSVCGISSLGFDHMQILGNTLPEIAGEKAGILKPGVPAFTVPQPEEAMSVLRNKACELSISLETVPPLDLEFLQGLHLGLAGEHQCINAALAVALCMAWAKGRGDQKHIAEIEAARCKGSLPEPYIKGLASAHLPGRAQLVHDPLEKGLTFFLDGAHSPESMEVCARWFCSTCNTLNMPRDSNGFYKATDSYKTDVESQLHACGWPSQGSKEEARSRRILLFNCMPERDPKLLIPPLLSVCHSNGMFFHQAMFVPGYSSYTRVGIPLPSDSCQNLGEKKDLSWQYSLQRTWENLIQGCRKSESTDQQASYSNQQASRSLSNGRNELDVPDDAENMQKLYDGLSSVVLPSLPAALTLLRQCARRNPGEQLQVLVTGSLHLVGDILRLLKK